MFLSLKPIAVLSQKETPERQKPGNKRANIFWEQEFFFVDRCSNDKTMFAATFFSDERCFEKKMCHDFWLQKKFAPIVVKSFASHICLGWKQCSLALGHVTFFHWKSIAQFSNPRPTEHKPIIYV